MIIPPYINIVTDRDIRYNVLYKGVIYENYFIYTLFILYLFFSVG